MKDYLSRNKIHLAIITLFVLFVIVSWLIDYQPASTIFSVHFFPFFKQMILFLPFMFILIGLGDVWIKKEKVERYIGVNSGFRGGIIVILLSMTQAGPLYGAFPVVYLLWKKGARIRNLFLYIGGFCTLKIPMLAFESGFLGLKFTLLRTIITIPVILLIAIFMERYYKHRNFTMREG